MVLGTRVLTCISLYIHSGSDAGYFCRYLWPLCQDGVKCWDRCREYQLSLLESCLHEIITGRDMQNPATQLDELFIILMMHLDLIERQDSFICRLIPTRHICRCAFSTPTLSEARQ